MTTHAFDASPVTWGTRSGLPATQLTDAQHPLRRADDPPRGHPLGAAAMALVLDEVDYGLVLVDADDQVQHANHAARAQLQAGLPLQLQGRRLVACRDRDTAALQAAMDNARRRGLRTLVAVTTGLGQRATLAVTPLQTGPAAHASGVLVMLGKRRMCEELTALSFGKAHGLTPTETQVLMHLCNGDSPAEAARRCGVKVSTTRTHISSIRTKLGAHNLDEMMRTVALLPPLVGSLRVGGRAAAAQAM